MKRKPFELLSAATFCALVATLSGCVDAPDESLDEPTAAVEEEAEPASEDDQFRELSEDPLIASKQIADMLVDLIEATEDAELGFVVNQATALIEQAPLAELTTAERADLADYWEDVAEPIQPQLYMLATYNEFPGLGEYQGSGCYTRCAFFVEFACENSQPVGACFGFWGCNAGIGLHECFDITQPSGETCGDDVCPAGWRCAKWAFKPDECVKECDDDNDCPGTQECKKPFGTSFKRCVD